MEEAVHLCSLIFLPIANDDHNVVILLHCWFSFQVIDFGSGKGYLGNQLVLQHGISVMGFDARGTNTASAVKRSAVLNKQWTGLQRHEELSKKGIKLTKREKKKLKALTNVEESNNSNSSYLGNVMNDSVLQSGDNGSQRNSAKYVPCTMFIDKETNFLDLLNEHLPEVFISKENYEPLNEDLMCRTNHNLKSVNLDPVCSHSEPLVKHLSDDNSEGSPPKLTQHTTKQRPEMDPRLFLSGLHTCGNLASSSLEIFVANSNIQALCNVGCCYHMLDEKFSAGREDITKVYPSSGSVSGIYICIPIIPFLKICYRK